MSAGGVPAPVRKRVQAVLARLVGQENPTRGAIERALHIAGDTAGLTLRSSLAPGREIGGSLLVLEGDFDRTDFVLSADNSVSEELGRYQVTGSVAVNSALGAGEKVVLTAAWPGDEDIFSDEVTRRFAGLSIEAPVGDNGVVLGLTGMHAISNPQGAVASQRLESEFSRIGVFSSYPMVRSRAATHVVRAGLDVSEERQLTRFTGAPVDLFYDRTTVARAGVAGSFALHDGVSRMAYDLELSRGIDLLGARTADDSNPFKPLSRTGADAEFTRLSAGMQVAAPLGAGVNVITNFQGVTGFGDPLLRSEQGAVVGAGLVSGPPAGSVTGDTSLAGRLELEKPIRAGTALFAPYMFVAGGYVQLENPTALETERERLSAVGAGVRANFEVARDVALSGRLEWSLVESERQPLDRSWLNGTIAVQF